MSPSATYIEYRIHTFRREQSWQNHRPGLALGQCQQNRVSRRSRIRRPPGIPTLRISPDPTQRARFRAYSRRPWRTRPDVRSRVNRIPTMSANEPIQGERSTAGALPWLLPSTRKGRHYGSILRTLHRATRFRLLHRRLGRDEGDAISLQTRDQM
jgi:hypothetical protein